MVESSSIDTAAKLAICPEQRGLNSGPIFIPDLAESSQFTFVALHGAWHSPEYFNRLGEIIRSRGHVFVAPSMPIEDPKANYSDYAEIVRENIADHGTVHILAHSRSCNVAPLVANHRPVESITYLCGTIPALRESYADEDLDNIPQKYSKLYQEGIILHGDGALTSFNPDIAQLAFYSDCAPDIAKKATSQLRVQRIREDNVLLDKRPDALERAVIGRHDRVLNPVWLQNRSIRLLGKAALELPTGHSPFLSHPELLAGIMIRHALADSIMAKR